MAMSMVRDGSALHLKVTLLKKYSRAQTVSYSPYGYRCVTGEARDDSDQPLLSLTLNWSRLLEVTLSKTCQTIE